MATTVSFLGANGSTLVNLAGSGIGFFGSNGFGYAVQIGSYQDRMYITNANGTNQGPEISNFKYTHPNSGIYGQLGASYYLRQLPNSLCPLNIRIQSDSPIQTQNGRVYIYDRSNVNNGPSGVTCQIFECIRPFSGPTPTGSGSSSWVNAAGTGTFLSLSNSPGLSGIVGGSATQHDYYLGISSSPNTIGSKTQFGLLFQIEYI